MSAHKNIDKICVVVVALTLVLALVFCNGKLFGVETSVKAIGYEDRIFDDSKVHTFDIVIDDWDSFLETCENEEYSSCNVVIDGEAVKNVGIRGKGNTSLSSVKNMDSNRYSFKIEFDQYDKGKTYHGLDKLCLNNIIQDNTYMKDYLAYKMMKENGVDTPLFSYIYITVNGEDWGLYLAVEAVEESFLERNYGSDYGELRVESVKGQFDGTIPSTTDGQNQDSSSLIDTGNLNISDMGSMGNKGGFGGNKFGNMPEKSNDSSNATPDSKTDDSSDSTLDSSSDTKGNSGVTSAMLEDTSDYIEFAANAENQNGEMPQPPGDFDGDMPQPPGDFDPENMPEDFDPNNMPQNPDQNNQSDSSASGDDSDSSNAQGNMAPPSDNQQQGENQNANQNTPQSDNMPNMMGDESATDLTSYILLGVSAVVLILGLGFAFKFRR